MQIITSVHVIIFPHCIFASSLLPSVMRVYMLSYTSHTLKTFGTPICLDSRSSALRCYSKSNFAILVPIFSRLLNLRKPRDFIVRRLEYQLFLLHSKFHYNYFQNFSKHEKQFKHFFNSLKYLIITELKNITKCKRLRGIINFLKLRYRL